MHKILLIISISLLISVSCRDSDTGMGLDRIEPARSVDERGVTGSVAGEAEAAGVQDGFEEKIIKTAYATIKTPKVEEAYDKTLNLVKKYDAIILNAYMSEYADVREAQLLIKLPPEHFMAVLDELPLIGTVESKSISEEDVTEEYYDIEARLANARKVQDRLYGILKKSNRVEDILKVEKEIERVGEKIEVLEGKIRYFDSKVDYSRITITIYSRKTQFIDLGTIGRGFQDAIKYAVHFFFIIIWFIIIIIPLVAVILIMRPGITFLFKRIRHKKTK
jgi:hypothetical protein